MSFCEKESEPCVDLSLRISDPLILSGSTGPCKRETTSGQISAVGWFVRFFDKHFNFVSRCSSHVSEISTWINGIGIWRHRVRYLSSGRQLGMPGCWGGAHCTHIHATMRIRQNEPALHIPPHFNLFLHIHVHTHGYLEICRYTWTYVAYLICIYNYH